MASPFLFVNDWSVNTMGRARGATLDFETGALC